MPIVQLLVNNLVNGSKKCIINYNGRYNIQILNIQYHDSSANGQSRVIQFQSPELYLINSGVPYLTIITHNHNNTTFDSGYKYHLMNVAINSSITIAPIDIATGTTPTGFTSALITLNLEESKYLNF